MSKIQRLASSLCPGCDGDPCGNCRDVAASILADPGPLLAALAEAGVLRECERLATRMVYDADGGPTDRVIITERRYVTEWRADD